MDERWHAEYGQALPDLLTYAGMPGMGPMGLAGHNPEGSPSFPRMGLGDVFQQDISEVFATDDPSLPYTSELPVLYNSGERHGLGQFEEAPPQETLTSIDWMGEISGGSAVDPGSYSVTTARPEITAPAAQSGSLSWAGFWDSLKSGAAAGSSVATTIARGVNAIQGTNITPHSYAPYQAGAGGSMMPLLLIGGALLLFTQMGGGSKRRSRR